MECFREDLSLFLETDISMYLDNQELDRIIRTEKNQNHETISWVFDDTISSHYDDSSSPDGSSSSLASNNTVSERNRRKKINERLFALRAVVPNITKMDKASIIQDAISYVKELHEQEKNIKSDIKNLEYRNSMNNSTNNEIDSCLMMDYEDDDDLPLIKSKKKRKIDQQQQHYDSNGCCRSSIIDDLEVRVSHVGERTIVVSLTCSKREGTMVKLCEMFEALKLKIITAHISTFAGRLLNTVFLEADEREKDQLRIKIETMASSSHI